MYNGIATRLTALVLLTGVVGMVGCASGPSWLSPPAPSQRIEKVRVDYNQGEYYQAMVEAQRAAGSNDQAVRDEANYLAGLCAHQLGDLVRAEQFLQLSSGSGERLLSGQSQAELALIYQQQGRHRAASEQFLASAVKLPQIDRANAFYYAAVNQQKLGYWTQARTNLFLARKLSLDDTLRQMADDQLSVTGYTLQLGAFASESNAQQYAQSQSSQLIAARVGAPRITGADNEGQRLHLVQVGRFTTFESAAAARQKIQAGQAIVVPLAQP